MPLTPNPNQNNAIQQMTKGLQSSPYQPFGKFIAGQASKLIPIPKVVAPANFQGNQNQYQAIQQRQYQGDIQKQLPSNLEVLKSAGTLGANLGTGLGTSQALGAIPGMVGNMTPTLPQYTPPQVPSPNPQMKALLDLINQVKQSGGNPF